MTLRPCLTCGEPADNSRCLDCAPEQIVHADRRGTRREQGYSAAWDRLSAKARKLQPFCLDCGATERLTLDHLPHAWERVAAGKTVRLQDTEVVCGPCNTRRGSSRPGTPRARAAQDQGGQPAPTPRRRASAGEVPVTHGNDSHLAGDLR